MKSSFIKSISAAALLAAGIGSVYAVPAWRGIRTMTQPDGSVIEYRKIGDERNHIILSSDGALLTWNGPRLEYATVDPSGMALSTGILAHNPEARDSNEERLVTKIADDGARIFSLRNKSNSAINPQNNGLSQPRHLPGRITSSFPPTGESNVLVILVQYNDVSFRLDNPYEYFNGMLNDENFSQWGATGCAKEYFRINSKDQFKPRFDVYGPVTLPQSMAYYGGNNAYGSDTHPAQMITHAVELLDPEVDFSQYDMDNDGYVDNVFVIYAGQGEATYGGADTVWPHSGNMIPVGEMVRKDQVMFNHYACCNEWLSDRPDGVGTFIHEFSHVIGLPDLYSTEGRLNSTPSSWSVLDYGPYNNNGCTPPNYSAYERCAMGWMDPRKLEGTMNLRLEEIGDSNDACIITLPGTDKEYFLFENRQQTGWDTYLPGHGMLIWHVDYDYMAFEQNTPNNDANHQRVDIIEAGGKTDMSNRQTLATYPWPGTLGKTEIGFETSPALKTWAGTSTGIELTEIEESEAGVVSARINGGVYTIDTPEIKAVTGSVNKFDISWSPVSGASSYELEVTAVFDGESGEDTNNMGKESRLNMPEGWTAGSDKVYTTSGNYGQSAPSYKMETDQDWMLSPVYPSDVTFVSFWIKGIQTKESTISVLGLKDDEWVEITSIEPQNNKAGVHEVNVPAGIRQIKLLYNMVKGRVALDDITVVYGNPDFKLEGYAPRLIEGATAVTVDCSAVDACDFSCRVRACTADDKSRWSEPMKVKIEHDGITTVTDDVDLRINGREVSAPADMELRAYDLSGRLVGAAKGSLILPGQGLYIVAAGTTVRKVIIK